MSDDYGYQKGEKCGREGCVGIIACHETETSCRCHINPPCSHCTTLHEYCPACEWDAQEEQAAHEDAESKRFVESGQAAYYEQQNKKWEDARNLFYQKFNGQADIEKLEMRTEYHTHFTQKVIGVFPKGSQTKESLLPHVKGTFGGRFEHLVEYSFKYIAYTD